MNKQLVNKLLLLNVIFLPIVPTYVYGCRPCVDLNDDCGDVGGGMGTCEWDGMACVGQCTSYCPSGAPDEYCLGLWFNCETRVRTCSTMLTFTCLARFYGPPSCACEQTGTAGNCSRQVCVFL